MDSGSIKPGWVIALGTLWGVTVGVLIVLITRATKSPLGAMPPINIWNVTGGTLGALPMPSAPMLASSVSAVQLAAPEETKPTRMATYTLQTDRAVRIMTAASQRYWRVQLRTIGPPGGVARVSTDINGTAYPSASIAVPAGDPYELRVKPGDALFAIGNIPNVELSVAAGEELT